MKWLSITGRSVFGPDAIDRLRPPGTRRPGRSISHLHFPLSNGNRPSSLQNPSPSPNCITEGWLQKVQLEFDSEDARTPGQERKRSISTSAVGQRGESTSMDEPVLLAELRTIAS